VDGIDSLNKLNKYCILKIIGGKKVWQIPSYERFGKKTLVIGIANNCQCFYCRTFYLVASYGM